MSDVAPNDRCSIEPVRENELLRDYVPILPNDDSSGDRLIACLGWFHLSIAISGIVGGCSVDSFEERQFAVSFLVCADR